MPTCPYAPHRLVAGEDGLCRHCGGDLRLYAALRDLPAVFFNRARARWEDGGFVEARGWLQASLALRSDLKEAHWLLGAVEAALGRPGPARRHLGMARLLGAEIDAEEIIAAAMRRHHRRPPRASRQRARQARAATAG
jgi:hypothetical protein